MQLPFPTNWEEKFGRSAPVVLEMGFGNGVFLAELARQQPQNNVIGIERAHSPMDWTEKRILRSGLTNVRLIYGDAYMALMCLFEPGTLHAVHVNFSDPWHKQRHRERRLIDRDFVGVLTSRLEQPGGRLYIATDIHNYATQIRDVLRHSPGLANTYEVPWQTHRDEVKIKTHYEKKARDAGRDCYYFRWKRTDEPVAHPSYRITDETMPNALLKLPGTLDDIARNIPMEVFRGEEAIINFKGLYRDHNQPTLLVEAFVQESLFSQHVMISIHEREPRTFLLRLAEVGFPRATTGIQEAAKALVETLLTKFPTGKVLQSKIRGLDSS